jgi:hypothetical protein
MNFAKYYKTAFIKLVFMSLNSCFRYSEASKFDIIVQKAFDSSY